MPTCAGGADLRGADLAGANLSRANLMVADLNWANLTKADLSWANLMVACLQGADLSGADLRGANLMVVGLRSDVDLTGVDVRGVILHEIECDYADLGDAILMVVDLREANLTKADLRGANLTKVSFNEANLSKADLRGASIIGTSLHNASLRSADLRGADLTGADLTGADLGEVNHLEGAKLPEEVKSVESRMNDDVVDTLTKLVAEHGMDLTRDWQRLKGLLSDYHPKYKREIGVLVHAAQYNIPTRLETSSHTGLVLTPVLARALHETYGMDYMFGLWAVRAWARALRIVLHD